MSVDSDFSWEFNKDSDERGEDGIEEESVNGDHRLSKSVAVKRRVKSSRKKNTLKLRETIETQLPDENRKCTSLAADLKVITCRHI